MFSSNFTRDQYLVNYIMSIFVYIYSFDHRKSDSSHSNKGMSPRPSIIRVAPATDAISNQTVDQNHPPRRSSFFDDSDFAVPKQEELDQASDAGRITSKSSKKLQTTYSIFSIIQQQTHK